MTDKARDGAYDDLLDAIEDGEGYYIECDAGHGWLPPRRVCPECGSRDLTESPLPDAGTVQTYTTISVATPAFSEDAPYTTAIVEFGPVQVTGLVREADPEDIEVGMPVGIDVGQRETTGDRALVFRPR
jgi:uncharacterized OB-fold protein